MQNKQTHPRNNISIYTVVLAIIFSLVLFFFFLSKNRVYETETTFLITTKNTEGISDAQIVAENLSAIPTTLGFLERLQKENSNLTNIVPNLSNTNKKAVWEKLVQSETKNGSIVSIKVSAPLQQQSLQLAKIINAEFVEVAGQYYDTKNLVSLVIIDGPNTQTLIVGLIWAISFSLALGIILAGAVMTIFSALENKFQKKIFSEERKTLFPVKQFDWKKIRSAARGVGVATPKNNVGNVSKNETHPRILLGYQEHAWQHDLDVIHAAKKDLEEVEEVINDYKEMSEAVKEPEVSEPVYSKPEASSTTRKGSAPANLPIYIPKTEVGASQPVTSENLVQPASTHSNNNLEELQRKKEEEYKKKLNQLLRGENFS